MQPQDPKQLLDMYLERDAEKKNDAKQKRVAKAASAAVDAVGDENAATNTRN